MAKSGRIVEIWKLGTGLPSWYFQKKVWAKIKSKMVTNNQR